jgi:hypothetical protein
LVFFFFGAVAFLRPPPPPPPRLVSPPTLSQADRVSPSAACRQNIKTRDFCATSSAGASSDLALRASGVATIPADAAAVPGSLSLQLAPESGDRSFDISLVFSRRQMSSVRHCARVSAVFFFLLARLVNEHC